MQVCERRLRVVLPVNSQTSSNIRTDLKIYHTCRSEKFHIVWKIFMVLNFCGSFNLRNFLTADGYIGQAHGAFLAFSLLEPGIAGCNTVAVRSSRWSDVYLGRCVCLFVDHRCVNVFICNLIFVVLLNREIIFNSGIFQIYKCMGRCTQRGIPK